MRIQTLREQRLGPKTHEDQPETSRHTRQIANELGISERRITKVDLNLAAFRRIPAEVFSASMKQKQLTRCIKRN